MNLSPKKLNIMGYTINGIALLVFAYVVAFEWRNDNEAPRWMMTMVMTLPLLSVYLLKKAKKTVTPDK